jgi:hypothetical protein
LEHIKTIFDRIYKEPFPSEKGKEILGVDLVLIDSDTIGLVSRFIGCKGHLLESEIKMLETCLSDLNKIVPELEKNEKQYFASLRHLAKDTLDYSKRRKISDNEVSKRHKWEKVYDQIKVIVNEIDPLGVSDIIDDEYDDLNFKIYSQLLKDRQDDKVFSVIKSTIEKDYEVQISGIKIREAIEKLKNINLDSSDK